MATSFIAVDNMEATVRALARVPDVMRARLVDVTDVAKRELATLIARSAPRRTGALAQSYVPSPRRGLTGFIGVQSGEIRGQRPEVYWRMVEFGTVTMAAQPHIVPTAERYGLVFVGRVQKAGRDIEADLSSRGGRFV